MRDETSFLERVQHDLREVRWAEPAELRARAARRRRRTVAGAAVAVLVVAAASAVVTKDLATPPPPVASLAAPVPVSSAPVPSAPVASTPVPSAEIPREAMVQSGDLSVATDPPLGESGLGVPVRIDPMLLACHEEQGLNAYWETSRYSRSQTLLRARTDGTQHRPAEPVFSQDVYRLAPQLAARVFARIDALLAPCESWRVKGEALWGDQLAAVEIDHRWEVTDRNFAGDEAVLIQHSVTEMRNLKTGESRGPDRLETTAVVRVGDLVTVLGLDRGDPKQGDTDRELRRVATVAADRLCVAANPPC